MPYTPANDCTGSHSKAFRETRRVIQTGGANARVGFDCRSQPRDSRWTLADSRPIFSEAQTRCARLRPPFSCPSCGEAAVTDVSNEVGSHHAMSASREPSMENSSPYRPRVSREARLLLTVGVMAVAALWLLARIRFPERPLTPNPAPSVLSQLASVPKYDDLAGEISEVQARLRPSLLALGVPSDIGYLPTSRRTAAVRLREDLAVTLVPPGSNGERWNDRPIVARDAASGLAVVRVATPSSSSPPVPWTPRQPQQPRYFVASDVSPAGVSLRPVFVGRSIRSRARCGRSHCGPCRSAAIWPPVRSCSPTTRNLQD